jgi:RNA polymerase sigma factor (sigma-70 family)
VGDDTRERDGTPEGSASDRDEPPIRFRGDEPELYLAYNHVLNGLIRRDVGAAPEDIEDACQFAWIQFFRYQPDRDRNWRAWLYRTAQREAWRLTAVRRSEVRIEPETRARGRGTTEEPADPRDRLDERVEFLAAMQELSRLSIRMQQTVIVRSQVRKQIEVAEILGVTTARVNYLLRRASEKLDEMATRRSEQERPVASPRAARLRELEDNPPKWLTEAIGRAPSRNKTSAYAVLAWRRAALAVDDYRRDHSWSSTTDTLGPRPADPVARRAHARAERAVEQMRRERLRQRGLLRER